MQHSNPSKFQKTGIYPVEVWKHGSICSLSEAVVLFNFDMAVMKMPRMDKTAYFLKIVV